MRIDLDSPVDCADGAFGELSDVVIDPGTRCVTHLVVQPPDRRDLARLVPIEGAQCGDRSDRISLECTVAQISQLRPIQESAYVRRGEFPSGDSDWDVGIQETYALPGYGSLGPEALGAGMAIDYDQHVAVSYHRVPKGMVELRRASEVRSSDGHHVGHIVGVVVDETERIAQLVVEHGHLWGKREISIPIGSVDRIGSDEVILTPVNVEVGR